MMKSLARCILALVLLTSSVVPSGAAAADPYDIHALVSLTGVFAFLGKEEAQALKAVENAVNKTGGIRGRPVRFVIGDAQSNPIVAIQLAAEWIAKKVPVIMGPEFGAACTTLAKNEIVEYCFSPSIHPEPNSFLFSTGVSTHDLAVAAIRYLREKGYTRIAVINATDFGGIDGLEQVEQAVALPENKGRVTIVAKESFNQPDISVAAQISRIKNTNAQVIYAQSTGTGFGTVLRGINDAGVTLPVITHAGNIIHAQMEQYAAFLPKDVYFTGVRAMGHSIARSGPVRDAQNVYFSALRAEGVTQPDYGHNAPWDAAWIIITALRKFGTDMTGKQFQAYLEGLHGFAGVNGIMDFRDGSQRGVGPGGSVIVRWDTTAKEFKPVSQPGGLPLR